MALVEYTAYKPPVTSEEYELLQPQEVYSQQHYDSPHLHAPISYTNEVAASFASTGPIARRGFLHTVWANTATLVALPLGIAGSVACFGFTYWLSQQTFVCPPWALYCEVPSRVRWMAEHLGQVQGFLSALYGVFISMIAYVAYKLAETTLWPAMTRRSFRFSDIDKFLEISRGSLPALPQALWHSLRGGVYHTTTIVIVGSLALLLFFNSVFVGHAYTVEYVPTKYLSNFTVGAGVGFSYRFSNPPGSFPGAVGQANAVYTGWANNMTAEPLPELRDFILDRRALHAIGNTTINAVRATRNVNCSAIPVRITKDISGTDKLGDNNIKIATHIRDYSGDPDSDDFYQLNNDYDEDGYMDVDVRVEPYLTAWVDQFHNTSATGAVTRLVFAAMSGHIEGAYAIPMTKSMKVWAEDPDNPWQGIDALTCDVHIELVDAQACIGACTETNSTLSSLETLTGPDANGRRWLPGTRNLWSIAVWLAVMPTTLGTSVFGNQPMFDKSPFLSNDSLSLPIAYTSTDVPAFLNWTQANITNFIDVAAGAYGITITGSFPLNDTANVTVASTLGTPRLQTDRSWVMLIPITVSVVAVLLLALLSLFFYRSANVDDVRLGRVGDIVVSVQTAGIRSLIDSIRGGITAFSAMEEMHLRYGIVPDGHDGLGAKGEVRRLR